MTDEAIRTFVAKVGAAVDADTIDSREDTTLNWMPMMVDDRGWRETAEILDRALRELMTVAADSRERLGDADGIPVVTAMAAFEARRARARRRDRRRRRSDGAARSATAFCSSSLHLRAAVEPSWLVCRGAGRRTPTVPPRRSPDPL